LFFDLTGVHPKEAPAVPDALPQRYTRTEIRSGGSCNLDSLNGAGISGPTFPVSHLSILHLAGWVADLASGAALPNVYVEIKAVDGKRFYLDGSRVERPDVVAAFHKPSLLGSGFAASGRLSNLPQGPYSLRILQLGPDAAEACDVALKLDVR
jgi:hypothetical protein